MPPHVRPGVIVVLAFSVACASGCEWSGICHEPGEVASFTVGTQDGLVWFYDGPIDPTTFRGCVRVCENWTEFEDFGVHSCAATFQDHDDTGGENPVEEVEIVCVANGDSCLDLL